MYIHDLRANVRSKLCAILDKDGKWEELCFKMQFSQSDVDDIKQKTGKSPTDQLLEKWSLYNHTVLELFYLACKLNIQQCIECLKPLVDTKYHSLIPKTSTEIKICAIQDESRTLCVDYEELKAATNDWCKNSILGKGGFGTVFKGDWKFIQIAIKRIEIQYQGANNNLELEQIIRELKYLNSYKHDNILPLYGYSIGGEFPCLLYQYLAGGSLDYRLRPKHESQVLNWNQKINIARGVARGLHFLHTVGSKPLIHGDIKPANILLDRFNEPKIGDFGLSREIPKTDLSFYQVSRCFGTRYYLPMEYLRGRKLSTKVDVFSFGIVLFELATSLIVFNNIRQPNLLSDFIIKFEGDINSLKDKRCQENDRGVYILLIEIGKLCVKQKADDRPEMLTILKNLL